MRCSGDVRVGELLDFWLDELPTPRASLLEEHLFACPACTARLEELEALAAAVRRATGTGRFRAVVAPSVVDLLARRGLRIRTFQLRDREIVPCGTAAGDELLVARIPLDLGGVSRVDVVACDEGWNGRERLVDVPFDPRRPELVLAERVDAPILRTPHFVRLRVLAVDPSGERELGTFALEHDPRGPPAVP